MRSEIRPAASNLEFLQPYTGPGALWAAAAAFISAAAQLLSSRTRRPWSAGSAMRVLPSMAVPQIKRLLMRSQAAV